MVIDKLPLRSEPAPAGGNCRGLAAKALLLLGGALPCAVLLTTGAVSCGAPPAADGRLPTIDTSLARITVEVRGDSEEPAPTTLTRPRATVAALPANSNTWYDLPRAFRYHNAVMVGNPSRNADGTLYVLATIDAQDEVLRYYLNLKADWTLTRGSVRVTEHGTTALFDSPDGKEFACVIVGRSKGQTLITIVRQPEPPWE